jgi:hypothetical protein
MGKMTNAYRIFTRFTCRGGASGNAARQQERGCKGPCPLELQLVGSALLPLAVNPYILWVSRRKMTLVTARLNIHNFQ